MRYNEGMKPRLWPWHRPVEPPRVEPPPPKRESPPASARVRQPASAFSRPYAPEGGAAPAAAAAGPPATLALTVEEARTAIRAAGGDVMQVGFLARAYRRQREEEPESRETAAARKRLSELVAKRLRDRKLLEPDGRFELLEERPPEADRT